MGKIKDQNDGSANSPQDRAKCKDIMVLKGLEFTTKATTRTKKK